MYVYIYIYIYIYYLCMFCCGDMRSARYRNKHFTIAAFLRRSHQWTHTPKSTGGAPHEKIWLYWRGRRKQELTRQRSQLTGDGI